jgi:hypothetical protein
LTKELFSEDDGEDDDSMLNFSFNFDLSSLIIVSRFLNGTGFGGFDDPTKKRVPLLMEGGAGRGGGSGGATRFPPAPSSRPESPATTSSPFEPSLSCCACWRLDN